MSGCPSSETLEQLLAGKLAEPAAHALRIHLRGCGQCQKLLDRLSDDAELRTWMAKAPHRPAPSALDPALVRVLAGLRTTPPHRSGSDTPAPAGRDLSLFLGPAPQEGDLGTLGPYTVQGELGRGGMGIVLRAWDPVLQRTVAVKMLRPELANERTRARFVCEAQAAARVTHDHVVRVYAVAHPPDGLPYFAMEYLAGSTLAEQIRTQQSLEPRVAAALVVQVAQGLAAAHAAGLIHRDIKPSNILLEPGTGRAKITDFGLARLDSQPSGTTQEGILAGTPTYMSPEQAQGLRSLDGRSDVYSLGATLYEALTGQTPFRGAPHMVLQQVIDEEPRPLRQLNDRIPRDLETICLKCLQKEPAQRYAGALALAQDLQRFLNSEPVQARPVGGLSRLARWCRRRPLVAGLAAGLVTVFCAGFAGVAWEWRQAVQSSTEALQNAAETKEQRVRAEQHLQSLREAVDKYYTRVSENQLLREPGLQPLRKELLEAARDYYAGFVQEHENDPALRAELARALFRQANITRDLGSAQVSVGLLEQALAIQEQLVHESPEVEAYQFALAQTLNSLGSQTLVLAESEKRYRRSLAIFQDLAQRSPGTAAYRRGISSNYNNLGLLYGVAWQREKAEKAYQDAIATAQKLVDDEPGNPDFQTDLVRSLTNLGEMYRVIGEFEKANVHFQAALETSARLVKEHSDIPSFRSKLGGSYLNVGLVNLTAQQLASGETAASQMAQARTAFEKALVQLRQLAREGPRVTGYQQELASALVNWALWCQLNGQWVEAEKGYTEALALFDKIPPSYHLLARRNGSREIAHLDYASLLGDMGRTDEALAEYGRLIPALEASWRIEERNSYFKTLLCSAYSGRAIVFLLESRFEEALADAKRALATDSGSVPQFFQFQIAFIQARMAGGTADFRAPYAGAVAVADRLLRTGIFPGGHLYTFAGIYSRASATAARDETIPAAERSARAERYAALAVHLLAKAHAAGFFVPAGRVEQLQTNPEFDLLHGRSDFQKLWAKVLESLQTDMGQNVMRGVDGRLKRMEES